MNHLSEEQIVDAADGALPQSHAAHLSACPTCASKVREVQAILLEVARVEAPDPSPLFWQRFSARVGAAIDQPQPLRIAWRRPWAWAAAALIVVGFVATLAVRSADVGRQIAAMPPPAEETSAAPPDEAAVVEASDIDDDEAWAVVRSLAADLRYEDAHEAGVVPQPGALERAATELAEDERAQLLRIIEEELKRTGA